MKIATSKENRKGIKVQLLPGVTVLFDQDGVGVLEDESKFDELQKRDPSISKVTDKDGKKDKPQEETPTEQGTGIESLKVEELQELCKNAGLEDKEWKSLKKADLVSYVKSNL
jgi:hypothetical protein